MAAVDYYQWTGDANHNLTGTLQVVFIDNQGFVSSYDEWMRGTLDSNNITITRQDGDTLTGTLCGDTLSLTLSVPQDGAGCAFHAVYRWATVQDYNTAVDALHQRAATGQEPEVGIPQCSG
jgi:hypothetical protein